MTCILYLPAGVFIWEIFHPRYRDMLKWYGGISSSLGQQIWESSSDDFCSFSIAFMTKRTAKYINGRRQFLSSVSLDRWLLQWNKLFRWEMIFFINLLLDSKESAIFLQVSKHFEKLIRSQVLDQKRCLQSWKAMFVYFLCGEAALRSCGVTQTRALHKLFKARAISHFLVTRLCAVKKLQATLRTFTQKFSNIDFFFWKFYH